MRRLQGQTLLLTAAAQGIGRSALVDGGVPI